MKRIFALSYIFCSFQIKSLVSVMHGVGEDFAKFVRSYSPDSDVNAKDVNCESITNLVT